VSDHIVIVASLLVAGYLLMAMEVFVIPGFGVSGIGGLLCLGAGCWLAFGWFGPLYGAVAVILVVATTTAFMIWFPRSRYGRDFVHEQSLAGAYAGDSNLTVGQIGQAESDLRPAGIARFGEQRESVVTEGDYIPADSLVSVIEVRGSQVVVEFAQKTTKGVPHKEPQGGS